MRKTDLAFYLCLFIANLLIAVEWGKHGFWAVGLQGPKNRRVLAGLVLGVMTVLVFGLIYRKTGFKPEAKWLLAVVGIPALLILFVRRTLPAGVYEYNAARQAILFWARTSYFPGVVLEERGNLLRQFPRAQGAVQLLNRAISGQVKYTALRNRLNVGVAYEELGFLYRMMNMWSEADSALRRSLYILQVLDSECPENEEILLALGTTIFRVAEMDHAHNRIPQAVEGYKKSLAIDRRFGNQEGITAATALLQRIEQHGRGNSERA